MAHPLKTYRAQNDLSLKAFAERVKSNASTISRIETGKEDHPVPELVIEIEKATAGAVTRAQLRPDLWGEQPRKVVDA